MRKKFSPLGAGEKFNLSPGIKPPTILNALLLLGSMMPKR